MKVGPVEGPVFLRPNENGQPHLRSTTRLTNTTCALLLGALSVSLPARADLVSYFLDQTNVDPALPDGTNYLRVDIEDVLTDIRFTVSLLPALTSIAGSNFGIQSFGFNVVDDLLGVTTADITGLPTGWLAGAGVMDGFGEFELAAVGDGTNRQSPTLTFFITGVAGDTPGDYAGPSTGTAGEGNQFFAAHVAGFNTTAPVESAFFGGSTVVPLPAAFWLFVSALGGLGLWRRRLAARRSALPVT